jgi:hypothetical protein
MVDFGKQVGGAAGELRSPESLKPTGATQLS